jgi:hypothetical protein
MKALIVGILFFVSATSAFANNWTCSAYCLEKTSQDVVMLVERAAFPQQALDKIVKQCAELNYTTTSGDAENITLFSSGGEHHEEATVVNSCKMFDPSI